MTQPRTKTEAEMKEEARREFLYMTPTAIDALKDIITDPEINPIARVQAIALVMDRGLGKAEENIKIRNVDEDAEEARDRLEKLVAEARKRIEG